MKSAPLVSVLIPTYNGERYLDQALACVQRQTYRNLEVLVRDDGSSDATVQIVESFCSRDRRFTLLAQDGRRLGGSGNMGELLSRASGDYIKFLHQDDVLERTCVERLVRPMRFDSALTMTTSSRALIGPGGEVVPTQHPAYQPLRPRNAKLPGHEVLRQMATTLVNQLGEPSVALFRNGVVAAPHAFVLDGVEYSYMNDLALWTNLLLAGDLFWIAEPLSSFRSHGAQRSAQVHEAVRAASELASYATFGVTRGLIRSGIEFTNCAGILSASLRGTEGLIADAPADERAARTAEFADAIGRFRAFVEAGERLTGLATTS